MSKPKEVPINGKNYFAWPYEEQTKVKHDVLRAYSRIWISKLGYRSNTLFFDCHGGCGAYIDDNECVSFGSSLIVKEVGDGVNRTRKTKSGIYYCEIDKKYYENYIEVLKDAGNPRIICYNNSFEAIIKKPTISKLYNQYPSLFLVDPFGYNFAVADLSGLMNSFGNEIIINFMFDFINRFIAKPELESTLNKFFGSEEWITARELSGQEREAFLVDVFKRKIKEITGAEYVFAYRLCYPYKDQTYYYLIHATNHIDGITLMKDAFASVNNGRVQYLGKKKNAYSFFELSTFKANELYNSFLEKHRGQTLSVRSFWREIVEDTAFTQKDLSNAIKELEMDNKVKVTRVSSKRGTYKEDDILLIL